jgi:hypothetical protein
VRTVKTTSGATAAPRQTGLVNVLRKPEAYSR